MTNNMIGDVLKRTRTIYGYKANEMSSALGISASYLSEMKTTKNNLLWNCWKSSGYLWYSFILANSAFRKYGGCRKSRERNCLYQKYDGAFNTKYV